MTAVISRIAEINELHQRAQASVKDAVQCARQIGERLLAQKATMKHGEFVHWVETGCPFSVRQAQRYMSHASGKLTGVRDLFVKNDTMSYLPKERRSSEGVWEGERWRPEVGYMYVIRDADSVYWLNPAENGGLHVCKHYSGQRLSAEGFSWRYAILAEIHDPDLEHQFYVGSRYAPFSRSGIQGILKSYGLDDLKSASIRGFRTDDKFERPFGEPDPRHWYFDGPRPTDEFYAALDRDGLVNEHGAPLIY